MAHAPRLRLTTLPPLALLLALAASACGGEAAAPAGVGPGVDREAFIAAYVDLRTEAIRAPDHRLTDETRAEIMARHGVTEEGLVAFAELHGGDVAFMRGVWDEVEARLDAARVLPDGGEG